MECVSHTERDITLDKPPPRPQCNGPNVNIFALVISWQGFNGLDVLPFTAEVHVLRKHGSQ